MKAKLTDAKLCEELECLLGASEDIPLMVSLLLVLGLITCRPVGGPEFAGFVKCKKCSQTHASLFVSQIYLF